MNKLFVITIIAACLFCVPTSPAATLTWDNGATDFIWDFSSANWNSGSPWSNGSDADFNTTGAGSITIDSGGTVTANSLSVASGATGYIFNGGTLTLNGSGINANESFTINAPISLNAAQQWAIASSKLLTMNGSLSGTGALTKSGTGTLTLATANTHTGGTTIDAGVVKLGSTSALGAPSGSTLVTINSGAALDLNGNALNTTYGGKTIILNGPGVDPNFGAVGNSGPGLTNVGLPPMSLASDAAIGNNGNRLDMLGAINGGGFTLTKVGNNYMAMKNSVSNLAALVISNGIWSVENGSGLGSAAVTVAPAGTLQIWNPTGFTFANPLTMEGGLVRSQRGNNVWDGTVNLAGAVNRFLVDTQYAGTTLTVNGTISGSGNLQKTGGGTLTLTGTNPYIGITELAGGVLTVSGNGAITQTDRLRNSASLTTLNVTDNANITAVNYMVFGDANNASMTVNQSGGTITSAGSVNNPAGNDLSNRWGHWPSAVDYNLSGGTLNILNAPLYLSWNGSAVLNISDGTVNIEGIDMGYGGRTQVSTINLTGGTLNIGATGIYTGGTANKSINLGGGTVGALATWSSARPMTLTGTNGDVTIDTTGGDISLSGAVDGTGGLIKTGTGTLTLSGNNTYSGTTAVNQGVISITGGYLSLSTPINIASGATLTTSVNNTFSGGGAGTPSGAWTIAGTIAGTANAQTIPSSITLNNGTMTGNFNASYGTFLLANAATVTANGANNTINAGNIGLVAALTFNTPLATDVLSVSSAIGATSANSGSLIKSGAGTVTLGSASTYTGGTTINGGLLVSGNATALGNPSGGTLATVNSGGALEIAGISISGYGSKTIVISGPGLGPDFGAIGNSGATMYNTGVPNLLLASDAAIGNNGGRFGVSGTIDGGGFTLYKVGTDYITAPTIINLAALVISNGIWSLENAAALGPAAVTVENAGTLQIWSGTGLTYNNALTMQGGTLRSENGNNNWNGTVNLAGPSNTFLVTTTPNYPTLTVGGTISGGGVLQKTGGGSLTINNTANSWTGGALINAGALQAGTNYVFGSGTITLNGGSLNTVGTSQSNPVVANAGVSSVIYGGGYLTGNISGSGTITKTGAGNSLVLQGDNSAYSGTFIVNDWRTFLATTSSGSANAAWVVNGGYGLGAGYTADLSGTIQLGALSGSGVLDGGYNTSGTIEYEIGALGTSTTFSGTIDPTWNHGTGSTTVSLRKIGSGSLTLTGVNTYTGGTTVDGGVLRLGTGGSVGTIRGTLTVNSGAAVDYTAANAFGYTAGQSVNVLNIVDGTVGGANVGNHFWNSFQLNMTGGTLSLGGGNNEFHNPTITANTSTLTAQILPVTGSAIFRLRDNTAATFNIANGSQDIDMLVSAPFIAQGTGSDVTKLGAGRLALTGGSITFRSLNVAAGSLTLGTAGGVTTLTGGIQVGNAHTSGGGSAGLDINYGSLTTAWIQLGNTPGTAIIATVNQTGGWVRTTADPAENAGVRLGHYPASTTFYNMSGGTLTVDNGRYLTIAVDGVGTFYQTGGEVTADRVVVNARGNGLGSGTLTIEGGRMTVGSGGIVYDAGLAAVNLGGGTLSASAGWSSSMPMTLTGTGGNITFDPAGNTISLSGILSGSGGLTKAGAGTLTLSGASSYSGPTAVNAGTLRVSNTTGSATGTGTVTVGSGATLAGTGTISGLVTINNGGRLAPGASVGTITVGSLNLTSGSLLDWEFGGGLNDQTFVTTGGGLTINGGSFNLYNVGTTTAYSTPGTYNLINYSGSIGGIGPGALSVGNPQSGVSYGFAANGTWVQLSIGANQIWNGSGGTSSWSAGGNWVSGIAPVNGDAVEFGTITPTSVINNNDLTAGTQLAGITFSNDGSYTLSGNTVNLTGDVVNNTANNQTINLNLVLDGSGRQFNTASGTITVGGVISDTSGSWGLIKTGTSTLVLGNANTYTGGTTVNGGLLKIGNATALGLPSAGTLATVNSGGAIDLAGISLSGYTTKTLVINGPGLGASFGAIGNSGAAIVNAGVYNLRLGSDSAIGSDGNRRFGINGTLDGGGFTLYKVGDNYITAPNVINLTSLVVSNGTWSLEGANSLASAAVTIVSPGVLQIWKSSTGYTFNNSLTLDGGTLRSQNGDNIWSGPVNLIGALNTMQAVGGESLKVSGTITGSGVLQKTDAGTLTLSGNNNWTGGTAMTLGILNINSPTALGTGTLTITGGVIDNSTGSAITLTTDNVQNWNASFAFTGTQALNLGTGTVTLNAGPTVTINGSTLTVGGYVEGGGNGLTKAGPEFLSLAGGGTFGNTLVVNGGTLQFDGGNVTSTVGSGARSVNVRADSTLIITNDADLFLAGIFTLGNASGEGGNVIQSSGTLVVNGVDTPANGNRSMQIGEYPGETSSYTLTGGSLYVTNGVFFLPWNATAGTLTMSGGSATLQRIAFGTSTQTGVLDMTGGTLTLGSGGMTKPGGTTAIVNLGGGTVGAYADWTTTIPMTLTGINGDTTFDSAGNHITLNGALSGPGGLIKTGTGTLTLGASFGGPTLTINDGVVRLTASNLINDSALVTVSSGATFNMNGYSDVLGYLSGGGEVNGSAGLTFDLGAGSTETFSGTITGSSGLTVRGNNAGAGTQRLTGVASFNAITVQLANGASDTATLELAGTGTTTTTGNVNIGASPGSGAAVLNVADDHTLTIGSHYLLGQANGFAGAVNQSGGTITVPLSFRIGHYPNETSTYTMSGGVLTLTGSSGTNPFSSGVAEQSGTVYLGIDGTGVLNQSGGTITAQGMVLDNRYGGGPTAGTDTYTMTGGNLILGQWGIQGQASSIQIDLGGGTISASAPWSSSLPMTLTGTGGNITLETPGNDITLTGTLTGSGGLTQTGAGTLKLTAANSYGGDSAISTSGTLNLDGAGTAGTGTITALGVLHLSPTGIVTHPNIIASTGVSGTLLMTGPGTAVLTATSVFSNATTVAGGTLSLTTGFLYSNLGWQNRPITITNGAILEVGGWADGDTKGIGRVAFAAANIQVDGATIRYTGSTTTGRPDRGFTVGANGATLDASGVNTFSLLEGRHFGLVTTSGGTITLTGPGNGILNMNLGGTGELIKNGTGTWLVSGTNTYSSTTTINDGTLQMGIDVALGSTAAGTVVNSGGALDVNGFTPPVAETLSLVGSGVGGAGALLNNGATDVTLNNAITLAGNTTIGGSGNMTITSTLAGGVTLTKTGGGTITLTGNNSYTGITTITDGYLAGTDVADTGLNSSFGTSGTIAISGGALQFAGAASDSMNRTIVVSGTGSRIDVSQATGELMLDNAVITGSSQTLGKTGVGTVSFKNATSVTLGTLYAAGGNVLLADTSATTASAVAVGGTVTPGGSSGTLTIQGNAVLTAGSMSIGDRPTYVGIVNQSGGTVTVSGGFRMGHWANETSIYNLTDGVLQLTGTPGGVVNPPGQPEQNGVLYIGIDGTGVFNMSGGTLSANAIVLDGRGPTTGTDQFNLTGGTAIIGPNGINSGSLDANASIAVNLGGGTLTGGTSWSSAIPMNFTGTGGDVIIAPTGATTINLGGPVAGGGGVIKEDTGFLIFSGTNSYTGATTINMGQIKLVDLNSNNPIPNSATITVNAGTSLDGTGLQGGQLILGSGQVIQGEGVVIAATQVGNGAVISPGLSPGVLQFQNTPMTWTNGGIYHWEINDWTGVASNNWDYIDLQGGLTLANPSAVNQFTIEIASLSLSNYVRGSEALFPILHSTTGIDVGFNPSWFKIDTSGFGGATGSYIAWTVETDFSGNTLFLHYTAMIPEPTVVALLGLGGLMVLIARRLRRTRRL